MALARSSARLNCLRLSCTRSTIELSNHNRTRLFSTLLQGYSPIAIPKHDLVRTSLTARSLWGFSRPAPPPSSTSSPLPVTEDTLPETTTTEATSTVNTASLETSPSDIPPVTFVETPAEAVSPFVGTEGTVIPATPTPDLPIPDGFVPDAFTVSSSVADVVPQFHLGDFSDMGLISWTPAGLIRQVMELIHVFSGLPWFWTIIASCIFWRLVTAPVAITGLRTSARLAPYNAEIKAAQETLKKARGDRQAQFRFKDQMAKIYTNAQVNPLGMMVPILQFPVQLGMFFGVQKLCHIPNSPFLHSGVSWLPDLTQADPTYILPMLLVVFANTQISLGAKDMNNNSPSTGHLMNLFRLISVLTAGVFVSFPSGLLVSLVASSAMTCLQTLILRQPQVRSYLGIPILPPHLQGRIPPPSESIKYVKDWYREIDKERQLAIKGRANKFDNKRKRF